MSIPSHPARGWNPTLAASYVPPLAKPKVDTGKVSFTGFLLFLVIMLIPLTAYKWGRVPSGPLEVHANLLAMAPLLLYVLMVRMSNFPTGALLCVAVFITMYTFSVLAGAAYYVSYYQEILKMGGGVATTVGAALCIRSIKDFRLAVFGICLGVVILSFKGFATMTAHIGVNPLELSNENGWSLYSLPPVLLGGLLMMDKSIAKWLRVFFAVSIAIISVAILTSANRSGWLGLGLIVGLLMVQGNFIRSAILFGIVGVASFFVLTNVFSTKMIESQLDETVEGHTADHLRGELFLSSMLVGIENPILGVSPQGLYFELARRVNKHYEGGIVDPHNVVAHLVGGTGLVCSGAFALFAVLLWRRGRGVKKDFFGRDSARLAHRYLKLLMILWIVRGLFSREILYMPVFAAGMGICIGLCIVEQVWVPAEKQLASQAKMPRNLPPGRRQMMRRPA